MNSIERVSEDIFRAVSSFVDRKIAKAAKAAPDPAAGARLDKLEQRVSALAKDLAALRRELGKGQ